MQNVFSFTGAKFKDTEALRQCIEELLPADWPLRPLDLSVSRLDSGKLRIAFDFTSEQVPEQFTIAGLDWVESGGTWQIKGATT